MVISASREIMVALYAVALRLVGGIQMLLMRKIRLEANSKYFSLIKGFLYSKDKRRLVYVVPRRESSGRAKTHVVPSSVTTIGKYSIGSYNGPSGIILGKNVTTLEERALAWMLDQDS